MARRALKFGSLFSGIGGLDLGFERAGMICKWQCEIDDYCCRVLERRWPHVPRYRDIREVDFEHVKKVDVICGGFPCQPVSNAGKRLAQSDWRWLWPEFARAIRALRPAYVTVENVPGLLGRGMGNVLCDLAELGYDAEWQMLSAAAFGAPHLRERVFIVAYANGRRSYTEQELRPKGQSQIYANRDGALWPMADPDGRGQQEREELNSETQQNSTDRHTLGGHVDRCSNKMADADDRGWQGQNCKPEIERFIFRQSEFVRSRTRKDGFAWWSTEPAVGRVAHGVSARVDRLRGLGNAVVPQVAEFVAMCIIEHWKSRK